jgi:hypothetical protein
MVGRSDVVTLSARELAYLRSASFLPAALARVVHVARPAGPDGYKLKVPHDIAEQLRSSFTDRLAAAGFDANYELTAEGQMLEDLIDRFHLR